MTRCGSRGRAGITLTEILISIMIMGVGLVSLATLFPLGLLRLRAAAIKSRSAFLTESAGADIATRNLLSRSSFLASGWYGPTYFGPFGAPYHLQSFDPWIQDTPLPVSEPNGVYRGWGGFGSPLDFGANGTLDQPFISGPGLPVAYDPLWRHQTGLYPSAKAEYRFANGIGTTPTIRDDPNGGSSTVPSAHGLQRLTNFPSTATVVPSIFVSPDDIIFQSPTGAGGIGSASPIVPDMSAGLVGDWMYTWMFTGRRSDASNGTVYDGDIVIFHGRPLAAEPPLVTGGVPVAAGETVVEAVFGYSTSVVGGSKIGYGVADRVVLLRWPATFPDPEVRVGSWIADVTYERFRLREFERQADVTAEVAAAGRIAYPGQRCHWYQVVKKSPADTAKVFAGDGGVAYRSMTVVVNAPVRAKTPLIAAAGDTRGDPYHVNVALVSQYVVNVFPKTFTTR